MKNTFAKEKNTVQINPRDLEIFRFIQANGAKTSSELNQRFWNEKSKKAHAGFQRVRKLIESGFLTRGNPQLLYLSDAAKTSLSENEKVSGVGGAPQA
jgi:hypothetical protein